MEPVMIGRSPAIRELWRKIDKYAESPLPCLITGETGSGKELVAREMHKASGRAPFVVVNCAGFVDQLLGSELFGHKKGAFTDAREDRAGLYEAADGGTLFLDEIGEFPSRQQPVLYRAIEYGEVRRVGATETKRVDVRVIAATNRDLEALVSEGAFREELFFRLKGITIKVPPLIERIEDLPLLAAYFANGVREGAEIHPETLVLLERYTWPGNVRELKFAIECATVEAGRGPIMPEHVKDKIGDDCAGSQRGGSCKGIRAADDANADKVLCSHTIRVLNNVTGNKKKAAELLGIGRNTLRCRLKKWETMGWIAREENNWYTD